VLRVYDDVGSEMLSKTFESTNLKGPAVLSLSSPEKKIAVYETDKQLLHLFGRNGSYMSGFPRRAGPFYTIGRVANKSTWSLLIDENDSYLYNYVFNTGTK
jgi:hypothetical protein